LLLTFNEPAGNINLTPGYCFDNVWRLAVVKGIDMCGATPSSGYGAQPSFINSVIASAKGMSCVLTSRALSLLLAGLFADVLMKKLYILLAN
jgi:hypothetical protein